MNCVLPERVFLLMKRGKGWRSMGPNVIREEKKKGPFMMFLDQFRDFMILVLIVAAVISGVVGEFSDTIAIIVIVILNAVLGFIQEYRAEKAMAALKKMAALTATVIRDSKTAEIQASELVSGDIVILEAGKIVPADMRLIEAAHLKLVEASLTGESLPAEKHTGTLRGECFPWETGRTWYTKAQPYHMEGEKELWSQQAWIRNSAKSLPCFRWKKK